MSSLLSFGLTIDIVEYKEMSFVYFCVPCAVICEIICYIYRIIYHHSSPFSQSGVSLKVKNGLLFSIPFLHHIQELPYKLQLFSRLFNHPYVGIEIYFAPAKAREIRLASMTHIALEDGCFVLSAPQFCRRKDYLLSAEYFWRFK